MLARSPEQKDKLIVKRVIATAGTTLHVPPPDDSGLGMHIDSIVDIPEDHVWLSGDNLPFSQDSRSYGPVPTGNLLGRLVVAVRPCPYPNALLHHPARALRPLKRYVAVLCVGCPVPVAVSLRCCWFLQNRYSNLVASSGGLSESGGAGCHCCSTS